MRPDHYKQKRSHSYKIAHGIIQSAKAKAEAAKAKAKSQLPSNSFRFENEDRNLTREEIEEALLRDDEDEVVQELVDKIPEYGRVVNSSNYYKASSYFTLQELKYEEWFQSNDTLHLSQNKSLTESVCEWISKDTSEIWDSESCISQLTYAKVMSSLLRSVYDECDDSLNDLQVIKVKRFEDRFPFDPSAALQGTMGRLGTAAIDVKLSFGKPNIKKTQPQEKDHRPCDAIEDGFVEELLAEKTLEMDPLHPQSEMIPNKTVLTMGSGTSGKSQSSSKITSKQDFEDFLDGL